MPISDAKNLKEPPDKEFMATLAKGLAVIRAFGADRPRLTLSQAAAAVGVSRAAARRVLLTLGELGYVEQAGRDFSLAPRVLELGFAYLAAQNWIDRALPLMKELSEDIAETCSSSVLQGSEIVYVARVPTRRIMTSAIAVGARLPAWHTAMGRIQLGFLPDEELWRGLRAARALTTRRERLISAIDVSAHANRTTRNEMRERFLPRLREIARQVALSTD
ncbi:MAG: helix-turn-helix domain-containing protein [Roseiarcus sp.]